MKPQVSDSAIPQPIAPLPSRRRMPVGTAPILPIAAEGTAAVRPMSSTRLWLRFTIASCAVLTLAAIAAYALYVRAARREAFEAAYPVSASATDAALIDRHATRWAAGQPRLLRSLAGFTAPPLSALVGAGACGFTGNGLSFTASPDLVPAVREGIAQVLATAERGRFASPAAVAELVGTLTGPIVVTAGPVRYAFDPVTGALACAGTGELRAVQ